MKKLLVKKFDYTQKDKKQLRQQKIKTHIDLTKSWKVGLSPIIYVKNNLNKRSEDPVFKRGGLNLYQNIGRKQSTSNNLWKFKGSLEDNYNFAFIKKNQKRINFPSLSLNQFKTIQF